MIEFILALLLLGRPARPATIPAPLVLMQPGTIKTIPDPLPYVVADFDWGPVR